MPITDREQQLEMLRLEPVFDELSIQYRELTSCLRESLGDRESSGTVG